MLPLHVPVIIVGAGPVGMLLSLQLHQQGHRVLLLEARPKAVPPRPEVLDRAPDRCLRIGLVSDGLRQRLQEGAGKPFAVLILDINNFKRINDQYGHAVGDEALIETVQLLQRTLRRSDTLARYGGDEFLIISDIGDSDSLQHMTDRIHQAFSLFSQQASRPYQLSLSIGSALYDPANPVSQERLLALADARMYQQKMRPT